MASSVEDYLIGGLSFELNPGTPYLTERRSVSYFTEGSNIYQSGSGARVIRINLTGDGWLDPSTVRLTYTLSEFRRKRKPSAPPHFRSLVLLPKGSLLGRWRNR